MREANDTLGNMKSLFQTELMSRTSYGGSLPDNIQFIERDFLSTNNKICQPINDFIQFTNETIPIGNNSIIIKQNKTFSKISIYN